MSDRVKNILIGLFVVGAFSIFITLVLFLKPTVGDGKKILAVRFANIAGISVGTRVTWAGKPIGEVTHIEELPHARGEADSHGRIYLYQLTLKIDSKVDVYSSDEIAIRTTGLMGEKSIAILPKLPTEGKAYLLTNQIAFANSVDPLENTFQHITKVASRLEAAIAHVDTWFGHNSSEMTRAMTSFSNTMEQATSTLKPITDAQGTIGKLIAQDDMYLRLSSLMSKGETLMNDINHFGLLFQYNKQWQKSRTKRAYTLANLETPQEFRSYFEGEIDTMTTSLSRLTELINQAPQNTALTETDAYRRNFAALMRQVDALSNSLKLYNESLHPPE